MFILFLGFPFWGNSQSIYINELMASNASTIADEDGDDADWIELYNAGNAIVSLQGMGLSDDYANPFRWVFPEISLPPGEFLLVWASGKDRRNPGAPLHTNFSLSASGEEVILTAADGTLLDEVPPTAMTTHISYGRMPDGGNEFRFFTQPSPAQPNTGPAYLFLLDPVVFSQSSGTFSNPFDLELGHNQPEAMVVYTIDGAEPLPGSSAYTSPIPIRDRSGDPNTISMIPTNFLDVGPPYYEGWQAPEGEVFKINVVRARALHPDAPPGPVATQAYLIHDDAHLRYNLPWFSLTTNAENFFDDEVGIYVPGNHNNYFQEGPEWERPANLIYVQHDGNFAFNEDIGVRLHGNTSKSRPRKSLRAVFRNEYGNSWLEYPLFTNKQNQLYKRFILRNSGNDWGLATFRDAFMQTLVSPLNIETQHYQPVVLFINGEYWGIHNMRDRYDENHFEAHYGIAEEEITILENNAEFKFGNPDGRQHYTSLTAFAANNAMTSNTNFDVVRSMMDVESFTDFQLSHIFVMNTDWPGNNSLFWRYIRDGYEPQAGARDGRWRWMMLDTDFGFGLDLFYVPGANQGAAHNTLAFALNPNGPSWPNPPWSTLLLRRLLLNQDYKHFFINRFADLLNTTFSPSHVVQQLDSIQGLLQPGMAEHIARWRSPGTMQQWQQEVQRMRNFANQRAGHMRNHIRSQFGIDATVNVNLQTEPPQAGKIRINTITPSTDEVWTGIYFQNIPLKFTALAEPGFRFVGWQGASEALTEEITLSPAGNINLKAVFEPSDDFPGDEMNPLAYRLANGPYRFTFWDANQPEGAFPPHMVFQQSNRNDPRLEHEMTAPYHIPPGEYHGDDAGSIGFPYRLTRRTRINGLFDEGISFINTGRGRDLGAAVLAIDTRGLEDITVSWTGGTVQANSRAYAIRLEYRIGHEQPFEAVYDSTSTVVEYYRNPTHGHAQEFGPVRLPEAANDRPYVQLRWKYYFTGQQLDPGSGQRDEIRIDDIEVSTVTMTVPEAQKTTLLKLYQNTPNPARSSTMIAYETPAYGYVRLSVTNAFGQLVATIVNEKQSKGHYLYDFDVSKLPNGLYYILLSQDGQAVSRKMLVVN